MILPFARVMKLFLTDPDQLVNQAKNCNMIGISVMEQLLAVLAQHTFMNKEVLIRPCLLLTTCKTHDALQT